MDSKSTTRCPYLGRARKLLKRMHNIVSILNHSSHETFLSLLMALQNKSSNFHRVLKLQQLPLHHLFALKQILTRNAFLFLLFRSKWPRVWAM